MATFQPLCSILITGEDLRYLAQRKHSDLSAYQISHPTVVLIAEQGYKVSCRCNHCTYMP